MPGPNMMTPPQLMRLIGLPDAPVVLDVRLSSDISPDDLTLPTAIFHDFGDFDGLLARVAARKVVVVCYKGLKLSQGIAARLRAAGLQAEVLEGGYLGWVAAKLPLLPIAKIPPTHLWVTRQRPKIDRIACPWLIRRFIDPQAEVLYVPRTDVADVAERFSATAFDTDGAPYAHIGDNCSFDALLDAFALRTLALDRVAQVVRAADTDKHALAPQAAGLLALSVGLSKQYRDDTEMLTAGMAIYDALYRWARDGYEEGHNE